jgi:hypothetical protein
MIHSTEAVFSSASRRSAWIGVSYSSLMLEIAIVISVGLERMEL